MGHNSIRRVHADSKHPPGQKHSQEEAHPHVASHKDKNWKLWEYEYTWNSHLEGTPDHGGIYIARKVKSLREAGKNFGNLKVILISDKLIDPDARDRVCEILKSEKSWFNYYDKANWEDTTEDWPSHLIEPNVFRWAVIHAINERTSESWGDSIESPNDKFLVVSKAMKEIVVKCKTLAKDINVNRILITGERGIGKSMIARMLHEMRMKATGLNGRIGDGRVYQHVRQSL